MSEKVRENRLRRMAARRRLVLVKSRRRDTGAWDFGTYALVNHAGARVFASEGGFGKTIDEIEEHLEHSYDGA